jgi:hypothetical protein
MRQLKHFIKIDKHSKGYIPYNPILNSQYDYGVISDIDRKRDKYSRNDWDGYYTCPKCHKRVHITDGDYCPHCKKKIGFSL